MTARDRFMAFFEGKTPDRIPFYEQAVASSVASKLLGRPALTGSTSLHRDTAEAWLRGEEGYREFVARVVDDCTDLADLLGADGINLPWLGGRPTKKISEYEYLFGDPDGHWSIGRYDPVAETFGIAATSHKPTFDELEAAARASADQLKDAPPLTEDDYWELGLLIERNRGKRAIVSGFGLGIPMEEVWLEAVILRPDIVELYLDNVVANARRIVPLLRRMGVDVLFGGYDLADKNGCIYGPKVFHNMVLPRLKAIVAIAHEHNLPYLYRTDGNVWNIADDLLLHSGVDGYGELDQAAGMDIGELREHYSDLTMWGGVPCGSTLALGTPEEVRAMALESIEKGKSGGGIILGSSNSIMPRTPPENVWAMVEVGREYTL